MTKRVLKILFIALKIIVTVLFIIVVNRAVPADSTTLAELMPFNLFLTAAAFSAVSLGIQGWRWYLFLKLFGMTPTIRQAYRSYFEGILFGIITPGRAGELLRGFTLDPAWRKDASIAVAVEKITATLVLFITGFAVWFFLPADRGGELYRWGIIGAGTVSLLVLPAVPLIIGRFYRTLKQVRRQFLRITALTALIHMLLIVQTALLLFGRTPMDLFESAVSAASAFSAMQFMPVTVANMGVREFCLSLFAQLYGEPNSLVQIKCTVLSVSMLILTANLLLPAVPGAVILITSKLAGSERRK